jgi:hypothetical protein
MLKGRLAATGLALAALSSALLFQSCKNRSNYATAYADGQSDADRRWNGRQCFFGSSLGSIKRLSYVSPGFRYDIPANDRGIWNGRAWLKPAILEGIKQLTGQEHRTVDDAIAQVDDKIIYYTPLTNYLTQEQFPITPVGGNTPNAESRFYLIEASMGDNWTGFVIQADVVPGRNNSTSRPFKLVNFYSDGDSYNCDIPRPTAEQRRNAMVPERLCAFGEDTGYLSSSLTRRNGIWRETSAYTALTASANLTEQQKKEISEGLQDFGEPGDAPATVADLIDATDDKEVGYREIKYSKNGKVYRWYSYYSGDNPHGFIFGEDGSGRVRRMAEIGDGSIGSCFLKKIR